MNAKDIMMKWGEAWNKRDEATLRTLIHPQYHFKGPMMELNGIDEAIGMMMMFPFKCHNENDEFILEGNKVVHVYDWCVTAPVSFRIPMSQIIEIEDGKIKRDRLFFDTALFPEAVKATMMKSKAA